MMIKQVNIIQYFLMLLLGFLVISCKSSDKGNVAVVKDMSKSEMEAAILEREQDTTLPLIDRVDLKSPTLNKRLTKDDFDDILVFIGERTIANQPQQVKMKLFVWGEGKYLRGYYHPRLVGLDIPFLGMMDGNEIALKTRAPNYLMEDGASLVGKLDGNKLIIDYTKKGQLDIPFVFEESDREYPLIFYATEDQ